MGRLLRRPPGRVREPALGFRTHTLGPLALPRKRPASKRQLDVGLFLGGEALELSPVIQVTLLGASFSVEQREQERCWHATRTCFSRGGPGNRSGSTPHTGSQQTASPWTTQGAEAEEALASARQLPVQGARRPRPLGPTLHYSADLVPGRTWVPGSCIALPPGPRWLARLAGFWVKRLCLPPTPSRLSPAAPGSGSARAASSLSHSSLLGGPCSREDVGPGKLCCFASWPPLPLPARRLLGETALSPSNTQPPQPGSSPFRERAGRILSVPRFTPRRTLFQGGRGSREAVLLCLLAAAASIGSQASV